MMLVIFNCAIFQISDGAYLVFIIIIMYFLMNKNTNININEDMQSHLESKT